MSWFNVVTAITAYDAYRIEAASPEDVRVDRHGLAGYGRTLMARRMLIGIEVER